MGMFFSREYLLLLVARRYHQFEVGGKSGSEVKAFACNAGDLGSIPGLGRSPGEGNGNPLQYAYLENPVDRGAWWAPIHGVAKSQTGEEHCVLLASGS